MLRPLVRPGEVRSLPFRLISRTFLPSRRGHDPKAVVLDLVYPVGPRRWCFGEAGQARF